jgi:hypothetical protein
LARLDAAAPWNASAQNYVWLSTDGDSAARTGAKLDRNKLGKGSPVAYLFAMEDPHGDNLFNLEADTVEARVFLVYETGAFDWNNMAVTGWKDSIKVQSFAIEYLQQNQVHRHVDTAR